MFENEIKAGAAYLDRVRPGWEHYIDLELLDMDHMNNCVIGQVFGNYLDWLLRVGSMADEVKELGFFGSVSWVELGEEWRVFITERLNTNT